MKSIFIYNQKGGIGKTTISVTLANGLTYKGFKVAIIDLDEQQSTKKILSYSDIFRIDCFTADKFDSSDLDDLKEYDYVIIDTSPRLHKDMAKIMGFCDAVLIPVVASQLDFWASDYTTDLFLEIKKENKKLKAFYIINKAPSIGNEIKELMDVFEENKNIQVLATLKQRKAYTLSVNKTVYESKNKLAIDEFNALVDQIIKII